MISGELSCQVTGLIISVITIIKLPAKKNVYGVMLMLHDMEKCFIN